MNTALHEAARSGDIQTVQSILHEKENDLGYINSPDRVNTTALHYAIRAGYLEIASLLLTHGADPNAQDIYGNTPFHSAFREGSLQFIKLLLKHGANPNVQNQHCNTPFHYAAHYCAIDIIKLLLLKEGANLNVIDITGITPFREVYTMFMEDQEKNREVMQLLVAEIVKLDHSGVKISESTLEGFNFNKQLISGSDLLKELEQKCYKEIEQMKSTLDSESNLSFFDIFILEKDKGVLARLAYDLDLIKIKGEFCMYSPFIERAIVEVMTTRSMMLQGAAESIDEIFESNQDANQESQTSWLHLPPELKMMILENLGNNDLTKLQPTYFNDLMEAELKGAYNIYEGE
ncbi:ankyrin repeat domain-containing protein [Orientia tsutsugamushi]|uniref:Ankyrin repeat family protein n=1 Tax=Orientia tsutsugamushi str. TA716 TaxID=1359175 RepID=A0A0F3NWS8_ORITS|nr:ankyrin repeat domain-containing protein [Orientia tsutsugamushi]KJV72236.1 ankyrin repeat family protein [Orientia tsutsugamushi str. TA716]